MNVDKPAGYLFNGILALMLSIIMWRLTGSWAGWFVLSLPGAAFVLYGWYLALKENGWF
jgi:hypothetical protein